jgi:hypothetical protein
MLFIEHNRSPFCSKGECQRARVQADIAEHVTVVKKVLQEETKEYLENNKREWDEDALIALVPASNASLVESSALRQSQFLEHISTIYQDVQSQTPEAHRTYEKEINASDTDQVKGLLGKACATCKGYCCQLGGTHAFLDYWSLERYLEHTGNISETQLIENYTAYLPASSYENSCVFHGHEGCTLPESMRSNTCNNYKCDGLFSYQQNIKTNMDNVTHAAARKGRNVFTIAIFSERTFEYVKE